MWVQQIVWEMSFLWGDSRTLHLCLTVAKTNKLLLGPNCGGLRVIGHQRKRLPYSDIPIYFIPNTRVTISVNNPQLDHGIITESLLPFLEPLVLPCSHVPHLHVSHLVSVGFSATAEHGWHHTCSTSGYPTLGFCAVTFVHTMATYLDHVKGIFVVSIWL